MGHGFLFHSWMSLLSPILPENQKKAPAGESGRGLFCRFVSSSLEQEEGEGDGGDDEDDGSAQTGRELGIGHEAHPVGSAQYGQVAGSATVGHAETGSDRGVDGVEAHQPADDGGANDGPNHDEEGNDDVLDGGQGGEEFVQVKVNADTDHDDHQEDLGEEGLEALSAHPDFSRDDAQAGQNDDEDDHVG